MASNWLADTLDGVGTFFNLPEFGMSEATAGGNKTANTGRVEYTSNPLLNGGGVVVGGTPMSSKDSYNRALSQVPTTARQVAAQAGASQTGGNTDTGAYNGSTGGYYSGGSTGGVAAPTRDLVAESMYQSGIDQTNNLIGQLGTRQSTALQNLLASYNTSKARSDAAYKDNESDNQKTLDRLIRENEQKKASIDSNVRNNMNALQRLLASRGAGVSSAAQYGVPSAVAQKGQSDRTAAQQTYNDNLDATNTNWSRYKREFDQARADAEADFTNKQNSVKSQFASQEGSLRQKLQELNLGLANARGGDRSAINAAKSQNAEIARLEQMITDLANQVQGQTVNYNDPKYQAAQTKDYNPGADYTLETQDQQTQDPNAYYTPEEKKKEEDLLRNLYGAA